MGAAKSSGTPNKSTRSVGRAAPETFTAHGKEHESTAAATRPERTLTQATPIVPSTAPARAAPKKIAPSTVKYTKHAAVAPADDEPVQKRARGHPAKQATVQKATTAAPAKRRPGRPPKNATKTAPATKKRGRPIKEETTDEPPKKRGRPSKTAVDADAVPPEEEQPTPKKRGRPPKGGETTKIAADDEEAAEQLEEELLDAADNEQEDKSDRKPQARAPKNKGKAKKTVAKYDNVGEEAAERAVSGKQYWLMKAEQDGHEETLKNGEIFNTKFTIDDLRAKQEPEPWDGVRNPTAAKNMREMKQGDLAFFYASGGKVPGIVGIMEIVREHELDKTTSDPNSYGYVENEKQRNKWCVVHVTFRKKLTKPITRKELLQAKDDGPLSKMQEFNAARLSVSKVSEDEWDYIMELINANEGEDALPGAEADDALAPITNGEAVIQKEATTVITEQHSGNGENEVDLPTVGYDASPPAIMTTTEDDIPTTDTLFPPNTSAPVLPSSRPTSRGTGVKTGSRPGSHAGSLAPAGNGGRPRSRSKTPLARGNSAQPESTALGAAAAAIRGIMEE